MTGKIVGSTSISLVAFACVFGGALVGLWLQRILPEHHLSGDSRDTVKVGTAFISTLTALVLGLLVSSAKTSFDAMNDGLTQVSANMILLDRSLARYGPESMPVRDLMRSDLASRIDLIWPEHRPGRPVSKALGSASRMETIQEKIQDLSPRDDAQRALRTQALQQMGNVAQTRWLLFEQQHGSLPMPLLGVLVFWLAIIFAGLGLLAPRNATVIVVLLVCALSASGAIFLTLEMNRPLDGFIKASPEPLRDALTHLGR